MRVLTVLFVAALLSAAPAAAATQPHVRPADREAIDALLAKFVPDVVRRENVAEGRKLVAGYVTVGSVQEYPAKGSDFSGWVPTFASPGDVGFDLLLQPTTESLGAWSFRAEAKKTPSGWKIVSWYQVATLAPPGKTQTVVGPNDFGPAGGSTSNPVDHSRITSWILLAPLGAGALFVLSLLGFFGLRALRHRSRVRELERALARTR